MLLKFNDHLIVVCGGENEEEGEADISLRVMFSNKEESLARWVC